jgi:hypothetical protein
MANVLWTEDDIETLKSGMLLGKSAREIGAEVNKTRNAVLGYIHRNFRTERKPRVVKPKPTNLTPIKKPSPLSAMRPLVKRTRPRIEDKPSLFKIKLGKDNKPRLFDISRYQCRWVVNREINPVVCGEPTHNCTSWCATHYDRVFTRKLEKEDG